MSSPVIDKNSPIGVFDSGVGGFSVVKELQKQLPGENLIYFGDSIHVPYGSKNARELLRYVRNILTYMKGRGVKAVVVACNTTSSLIGHYRHDISVPVFSIIETGCDSIAELDIKCLGVISTPFTAKMNLYGQMLEDLRPEMTVVAAGCPQLAQLIEEGRTGVEDIGFNLHRAIDGLKARAPITHLVLGCTHYPLVSDVIEKLYPELILIDPAREQVGALKRNLAEHNLLSERECGTVELHTSGDTAPFEEAAARFGLKNCLPVCRSMIAGE